MIKIDRQDIIIFLEIFILLGTLITIKMPLSFSGISLALSILVLVKNREVFLIDINLKKLFLTFGVLLLFFTFSTIDIYLSLKGFYDVLRAFLIFFVAVLLVEKVQSQTTYTLFFLFLVIAVLIGNFIFDRVRFWGYFQNPNNIAIEVFCVSMCSVVFLNQFSLNVRNYFVFFIVFTTGVLLFYANSRAIILGIVVATIVLLSINIRGKKKTIFQILVLGLFFVYLFFMNDKNLSLSSRDLLWLPLFRHTIENHFFFGTGLNSVKLVIEKLGLITHTAHNLFLEIFVSMGFIGLAVFTFLLAKLFKIFYQYNYQDSFIKNGAVFGIIVMFIVFQFDLKFSGYSFTAIVFYFLGLLYSQRIKT